jgi:hypothetical protein
MEKAIHAATAFRDEIVRLNLKTKTKTKPLRCQCRKSARLVIYQLRADWDPTSRAGQSAAPPNPSASHFQLRHFPLLPFLHGCGLDHGHHQYVVVGRELCGCTYGRDGTV